MPSGGGSGARPWSRRASAFRTHRATRNVRRMERPSPRPPKPDRTLNGAMAHGVLHARAIPPAPSTYPPGTTADMFLAGQMLL